MFRWPGPCALHAVPAFVCGIATLNTLVNDAMLTIGGGDSWHFGPMCLLSLNDAYRHSTPLSTTRCLQLVGETHGTSGQCVSFPLMMHIDTQHPCLRRDAYNWWGRLMALRANVSLFP